MLFLTRPRSPAALTLNCYQYWQDYVDLFNESNPSGGVADSAWHHRIVAISVSLGLVVAVKRFYLGLYLGRQTFRECNGRTSLMIDFMYSHSLYDSAILGKTCQRDEEDLVDL
jgi:hypothetical protein